MKTLVGLVVLAAVVFAYATTEAEVDDVDVIMSDVPLAKVVNTQLEGEHQANDMTTVIIIGIEVCNGTPI